MGYRFSNRIAKSILKIIDEVPNKYQEYDRKKRKGVRYSVKSDKRNYYAVREKVYERFQQLDPPDTPSRAHYQTTFNELEKMKMIKKELVGKLEEFHTTNMGHLCTKYDHEPQSYQKFYFVWAIICFRARIGIIYGLDGKYPQSTENTIEFSEAESGITPEDILEYENRMRLSHLDLRNYEMSLEELKDHFHLLEEFDILKKVGLPERQRYVLEQNYTSFILKSNTIFVKLLQIRMEFKWSYIDEPQPVEKEWYNKLFGIHIPDDMTSHFKLIREQNIKKKTLQQENEWYEKLSEYDNEIYKEYHKLSNESSKLDAMPGFVDTILSFVCPMDLMESIQLDMFLMNVY